MGSVFKFSARWGLLALLLGACTQSQAPLRIKDISVMPDPVIGQTATLTVEFVSTNDELDVSFWIELPPGVKHMGGELTWEGSLTANQPQSHEISICVLYEGDWALDIGVWSQLSETSGYQDSEVLHIIASGAPLKPCTEATITLPNRQEVWLCSQPACQKHLLPIFALEALTDGGGL
jgi:hypothetical protein